MRTMGIALQKNYLRYSVMEGDKNNPSLIDSGRLVTTAPEEISQLMDWFETQFMHLINKYKPERIGYKLTLKPSIDQIHTLSFPLGILNLLAYRNGIAINEFSTQGITPKKLGLSKNTDLHKFVDDKLGKHPPYWDSTQKEAVLVGWFCL